MYPHNQKQFMDAVGTFYEKADKVTQRVARFGDHTEYIHAFIEDSKLIRSYAADLRLKLRELADLMTDVVHPRDTSAAYANQGGEFRAVTQTICEKASASSSVITAYTRRLDGLPNNRVLIDANYLKARARWLRGGVDELWLLRMKAEYPGDEI